ncbi:hypothetical protein AK812_SmicGene18739 [Symbiodinium microadriaticum]|uniref:Uncharacterized protein n=1 Tax=Symbiodinium microadriaticum TaxID=2951 RepID=A0A1Q9DUD9_SYMMI|nr:hypothetical protein AK812_SmicGene18739 [Symbiodinium microadriaticum]
MIRFAALTRTRPVVVTLPISFFLRYSTRLIEELGCCDPLLLLIFLPPPQSPPLPLCRYCRYRYHCDDDDNDDEDSDAMT